MRPDLQAYLEELDELMGEEGEPFQITEEFEDPPIWIVCYPDTPGEGSMTAFTYGLSLVDHPDWKKDRPELVISVDSDNIDWGYALGFLVKSFRGACPFLPGNAIKFGERVAEESQMSAFVAYTPSVIDEEDSRITLKDRTIRLVQMYPLYEEEVEVLQETGIERFFGADLFYFYNVSRPRIELSDL